MAIQAYNFLFSWGICFISCRLHSFDDWQFFSSLSDQYFAPFTYLTGWMHSQQGCHLSFRLIFNVPKQGGSSGNVRCLSNYPPNLVSDRPRACSKPLPVVCWYFVRIRLCSVTGGYYPWLFSKLESYQKTKIQNVFGFVRILPYWCDVALFIRR